MMDDGWDDDAENWVDSSADEDSDDGGATVSCPYCQREIPEGVPHCPYCENYVSDEDLPHARKPWWIIIGVLVCLYLIFRWTVG